VGTSSGVHQPLRSYHPRRRGLTPARQARFDTLIAEWGLTLDGQPLDVTSLSESGDTVLDIGFGGGEGLIAMALADRRTAILGADVHTPGVAAVLEAVAEHDVTHVRVLHGDALELVPQLPLGSLAGVRIWFPDPWPKPKQRKRRLVRPEVVVALVQRLRPGGFVHLATDHADYAAEAQRVLDAEPLLRGGVIPRPTWRPLTRFEQRGLDEGRHPVDLWYERSSS
jgi:tRNA (guanine-N7-)-methyltransferase